jgi:uncharacterized SAM-binding protein YcdF (DUF218 family)
MVFFLRGRLPMYRFVVELLHPYAILWFLTGLAIANLWRKRRESRGRLFLITLPYVALTIMTLPLFSYLALGTLEWHYRLLRTQPADGEAIVVLGGSVLPADAGRARAELGRSTYARCRYAVDFYRQNRPSPIVVSGGRIDVDPSCPPVSTLMHDYLVEQGVDARDILVEERSRSSHENAVESVKMLEARKIRKIVLITEATHMMRAVSVFRRQGIEVIPAPCNFRATTLDWSLSTLLPSPKSALDWQDVVHEWLGMAWYWFQGRI